jgi:hypothetical protein
MFQPFRLFVFLTVDRRWRHRLAICMKPSIHWGHALAPGVEAKVISTLNFIAAPYTPPGFIDAQHRTAYVYHRAGGRDHDLLGTITGITGHVGPE